MCVYYTPDPKMMSIYTRVCQFICVNMCVYVCVHICVFHQMLSEDDFDMYVCVCVGVYV